MSLELFNGGGVSLISVAFATPETYRLFCTILPFPWRSRPALIELNQPPSLQSGKYAILKPLPFGYVSPPPPRPRKVPSRRPAPKGISMLSYISVITFATLVRAAGHNATAAEPPWVPEPKGRGTWGVLFTCTFTLFLCSWTALHDDLVPNKTPAGRLTSKIVKTFIALLAPEVMVCVAADQWVRARKLHKHWCEHHGVSPGSPEDHLGMEGAFFVVMGGFTVGPADYNSAHPPSVSVEAFRALLLQDKLAPSVIRKQDILDRGKADTVGKLLALSQALSIVGSCISRKISGLPVILLEIHVLTQALCACLMYIFWWYKPLNVCHPIPLFEYFGAGEVLGLWYDEERPLVVGIMATADGAHGGAELERLQLSGNPVLDIHPREIGSDVLEFGYYRDIPSFSPFPMISTEARGTPAHRQNYILPGESLMIDRSIVLKYYIADFEDGQRSVSSLSRHKLRDLCEFAERVRPFLQRRGAEARSGGGLLGGLEDFWGAVKSVCKLHLEIVPVLKWLDESTNETASAVFLFIIFVSIGALHCMGWNAFFPTLTEKTLWRVACLILVTVPPAYVCIVIVMFKYLDVLTEEANKALFTILCIPMGMSCFYFTVVGFISLRKLPEGSYQTTVWERVWPQI